MPPKILILIILLLFIVGWLFILSLRFKNEVLKFGAQISGFFSNSKKEKIAREVQFNLEKIQKELKSLKEELNREREMRKNLEEKYNTETSALIEKLDDLVEIVDTLSQKEAKVTESEVRKSVKEITQSDELATEEKGIEKESERAEKKIEKAGEEKELIWCNREIAGNPKRNKIIFNEIAWMGTTNSSGDEWIELKNISKTEVNLAGWQILDKGGQIKIFFNNQPRVLANGFYLLERSDDESVPGISADKIYTGALNDTDEALYLFNENCELEDKVIADPNWPAGEKISKRTMERKSDFFWQTSYNVGGTPKRENSRGYYFSGGGGTPPPEPTISLSYPQENPVDQEIEVFLSASNLENATYDVKISIETETGGILSQIYNEKAKEGKNLWQSSQFYLTELFSGTFFEGQLKLKIKEDKTEFVGQADIIARIRKTGQTGVLLEFKDKINIIKPSEVQPLLTPILAVSPQSLEFSTVEFNTTPQDGVFTIINSGTRELNWTAIVEYVSPLIEGIEWLTLNPEFGSVSPEISIQVLVSLDISKLSKGNYFAKIIIDAGEIEGSPKEVDVNLKVQPVQEEISKILINEIQILPIENRFIELYNPNEIEINLTGWYLQRKTEKGSSWISCVSSTQFEGKTIQPKSHFLISRNLENSEILLANLTLSENNSLVLKNSDREIVDLVGWGKAQYFETKPALNPQSGQSIGRKGLDGSYQDTDNNALDFEIQKPSPRKN